MIPICSEEFFVKKMNPLTWLDFWKITACIFYIPALTFVASYENIWVSLNNTFLT